MISVCFRAIHQATYKLFAATVKSDQVQDQVCSVHRKKCFAVDSMIDYVNILLIDTLAQKLLALILFLIAGKNIDRKWYPKNSVRLLKHQYFLMDSWFHFMITIKTNIHDFRNDNWYSRSLKKSGGQLKSLMCALLCKFGWIVWFNTSDLFRWCIEQLDHKNQHSWL